MARHNYVPLGERESHDTIYTLLVVVPPRPSRILDRKPTTRQCFGLMDGPQPNYDNFSYRSLRDMKKTKTVKIRSRDFLPEMRCAHIYGTNEKTCDNGCYVLEKGGDVKRFSCKNPTCEGHVYMDHVREGDDGTKCFGKKGERLVCVVPYVTGRGFVFDR